MQRALAHGVSWAGLLTGPLAWGISTQLNYMLAPYQCANDPTLVPFVALALALLAAVGGALSWKALARRGPAFKLGRSASTEQFVAWIGVLSAALFALVVLVQGSASLILDGCLR